MRIQDLFLLFFVCTAAAPAAFGNCFDFSKKIVAPLKEPPPPSTPGADNKSFGEYSPKQTWGKLRGTVDKPIAVVLELLLDHNNTRSPKIDEMNVDKKEDPNYLARHLVHFEIHPFPLITVEWDEEWGFALAAGKAVAPEKVVISYEKVDGTSHIEHLCGNMVLTKLNAKQTDVYLYEEAKATQRSPEDTGNGLAGTMKSLRK